MYIETTRPIKYLKYKRVNNKKSAEQILNEPLKVSDKVGCYDSSNNKVKCKTLIVHGTKYRTTYTKKYEKRKKWEKVNEKHILSFIPGTIKKVFIKKGEKVKRDQALLILEAMKMENTIFAPFNGKIKSVQVKKEDKVSKGELMIEFE